MLGILLTDLGELLKPRILFVLKADSELLGMISFVLCISIVHLWPRSCLVFLAWYITS